MMGLGAVIAGIACMGLTAAAGGDKKKAQLVEVRGSTYRVIVEGDKVEVRTPAPLVVWNQIVRSEQLDAVVKATGCRAIEDTGTDVLRARLDCSPTKPIE